MKNDTIVGLNTLEIDLLINILNEVVTEHKIPNIITKILTDLKEKLKKEKFEQLEELVEEEQNEFRTYAITLSDINIDYLRQGDYSDEIEIVVEDILEQIKQQES